MKRKLVWDGEKIKESVSVEDKKHSPKEIIEALDGLRGQKAQMMQQKQQMESQMKILENNLRENEKVERDLKEFEEKCEEIQKEKVELVIRQIHDEIFKKAKENADAAIAKDPNAYDDRQKKQLPYLNYQKGLATHEKMSEKVARRMITKFLYTEPIFKNPFE